MEGASWIVNVHLYLPAFLMMRVERSLFAMECNGTWIVAFVIVWYAEIDRVNQPRSSLIIDLNFWFPIDFFFLVFSSVV